jgi:hypothetical protein
MGTMLFVLGILGLGPRSEGLGLTKCFGAPSDAGTTEGTRSPAACRSRAKTLYPRGPGIWLDKGLTSSSACQEVVARMAVYTPMGVQSPMVVRDLTARGLGRIQVSRTVLHFQGSAWDTPWWLSFAGPRRWAIPWICAGRHFCPEKEICASRRVWLAERESFWWFAHESRG